MRQRVLVVEDDLLLQKMIQDELTLAGFDVITANDAENAMDLFLMEYPCLIILDLILPGMSGEKFCEWVREQGRNEVSIIIVSSKNKIADKVNGLKIGADAYITKPFEMIELIAKMEAVLRRTGLYCQKIVDRGLCIKPRKGEVILHDEVIHFTKHEFLLLYHFMEHPNMIFSRQDLINYLYDNHEKDVLDRTIDVHIKKIRAKIEDNPSKPTRIQTVRGIGYKYVND
ncbi:DNA-binding response regulator [Solibacillus sp. R5-41]|uniref:response regulator transcription factor n=1 Tax=Solibacillus sp. R5-41 TaxID=2048654 RepID=UPI000C126801|nr:response regulator transcription factor [Solibacillus sp. R5-41]ATP41114.1 DNA-binding response regulator [Solibacillus sp. R5-41]